MVRASFVCLLLWLWPDIAGAADPVRFASIEWPPYTSETLPEGGVVTAVVRKALANAGIEPSFSYLPYKRAVMTGLHAPSFIGYLTEYYSPGVADSCYLSNPVGTAPVGFVQKAGIGYSWSSLADLQDLVIGVVDGYVNDGGPFDAAVAAQRITVEPVRDDRTVVRKVVAGRNRLGVIDPNVLRYLLRFDRSLTGVEMNPHILAENRIFVCFRRTPEGKALREAFDRGLERVDLTAEYAAYFTSLFR
jgi:polar amino acid transport system substrate-binding protein